MARVVPSQVVAFIDRLFPVAAKQGDEKDDQWSVGREYRVRVIAILEMIERIPTELLPHDADRYADLVMSVAIFKDAFNVWIVRDYGIQEIPGYSFLNPISLIRRALATCHDNYPSPSTADLDFITDQDLRLSIRSDISSATQALSNGEWKAATVMAGAACEALLLWALKNRSTPTNISAALSSLSLPQRNLETWSLGQMINVTLYLQLIKDETHKQAKLAQDFRNLIHPGRGQRLGQACTRATALSALAAVEHIIDDLR